MQTELFVYLHFLCFPTLPFSLRGAPLPEIEMLLLVNDLALSLSLSHTHTLSSTLTCDAAKTDKVVHGYEAVKNNAARETTRV